MDAEAAMNFLDFLLEIGERRVREEILKGRNRIRLPLETRLNDVKMNVEGLMEFVYGEGDRGDRDWLAGRAILAPTNADMNDINETMVARFPGDRATISLKCGSDTRWRHHR